MNRRKFFKFIPAIVLTTAGAIGFSRIFASQKIETEQPEINDPLTAMNSIDELSTLDANPVEISPFRLSDADWKKVLSENEYFILRQEGTEPPGSSALNNEKRHGQYACSGCGLVLFESTTKYESGTGWPSFYQEIEGRLGTKTDWKIGLPRTEYHCIRCGGHQGHVFKDGPKPTGLRYCNNGIAIQFIPNDTANS